MKTIISSRIDEAEHLLIQGEVVAIPTETVYGLAANAMDTDAVLKIFRAKKRPLFNPLILHIGRKEQVHELAYLSAGPLDRLADACWPGPLTLLLPKKETVHDLITAGSPLVAVRMPDHPLTLPLLQRLHFPLAAPSANLFGTVSPTSPVHVAEQLDGKIPMILDGGPCRVGLESTIVKWENNTLHILRTGAITPEIIENVTGLVPVISKEISEKPEAPGQLKSHYAPETPLQCGDLVQLLADSPSQKIAVLCFRQVPDDSRICAHFTLSAAGSEKEAATRLFEGLRTLDKSGADCIVAELLPEKGLGLAVNDRLRRAATVS